LKYKPSLRLRTAWRLDMRPLFAKMAFWLLQGGLLASVIWGISAFTAWIPKKVTENANWVDHTQKYRTEPGSRVLFEQLVEQRLLKLDLKRLNIAYPPSDQQQWRLTASGRAFDPATASAIEKREHDWPNVAPGSVAGNLLALLYGREGKVIRQEIEAWNSQHYFAAIRDGRHTRQPQKNRHFVYNGNDPNKWNPVSLSAESHAQALKRNNLSVDLYGFLGASKEAPTGDWMHVSGRDDAQNIRFTTQLSASIHGPLVVDVVGQDPVVEGAKTHSIDPLCATLLEPGRSPRYASTPTCGSGNTPVAYRLSLRPNGRALVSVTVKPIRIDPKALTPYREVQTLSPACVQDTSVRSCAKKWRQQWPFAYKSTQNITVLCRQAETALCTLAWRQPSAEGTLVRSKETIQVRTQDHVALTSDDGQGYITQQALELGLAPLVGLGPQDRYGMSALLRHQHKNTPHKRITLTLRADIQKTVQHVLAITLKQPAIKSLLPSQFDQKRRVGLVLLDITDSAKTGQADVLAAVSMPHLSPDTSAWNAIGFDFWRPHLSALAPHAWARTDSFYAPGSTFKVLTGLTLIQRTVARNEDIAGGRFIDALRGAYPDKHPLHAIYNSKNIRLSKDQRALIIPRPAFRDYQFRPCGKKAHGKKITKTEQRICNFGSEKDRDALLEPSVSLCPPVQVRWEKRQYGLCEALVTSMNTWFMATALALDVDNVPNDLETSAEATVDSAEARPKIALLEMAQQFIARRDPDLAGLHDPKVARTRADPMILGVTQRQEPQWFTLAQNAIGQNVQASPLAMAIVYASIASGCKVTPTVIRLDRPRTTAQTPCQPIFFTQIDLEHRAVALMQKYLVPGLHGVVNSSKGTANRAFDARYRKHVYAKTGTAETVKTQIAGRGQVRLNTAWLVGWIDAEGTGSLNRRLAFACMISHAASRKPKYATGGSLCAPVINALLVALHGDE